MSRIEWGEFEYDGHSLLYAGYARMPPDQLPSFLLTADGDDRPHAWWIAQTRLYDLRTSATPSIREIRELLAQAIRHNRLAVPDVLREAERNADAFLRLSTLRDAFARRHHPPPTPRTSPPPKRPATPRPASPVRTQASPGAMPLQTMLAHPTLMSLPLAAPVPVPGPTPHPMPLFTLVPQPGGIPVPAPGPNPPPLVPAYARYAAFTVPPRPASHTASPTPKDQPMDEDDSPPAPEIDELADEAPKGDTQPDRPKKRSRPTRAHPSSPRVCTTCARTDSPEWRRGPYGPKTLCNACGLKWAKASGTGRRRGAQPATEPNPPPGWRPDGPAFSAPAYPGYQPHDPDPISRPGTADALKQDAPITPSATTPQSAPIGAVPPPPRSVSSESDEARVKLEDKPEPDVASGLMGLANVALESSRTDDTPPHSLKRPRADSAYAATPARYPDAPRAYDRPFPDPRPNPDSGVRPINVIPIGDKW